IMALNKKVKGKTPIKYREDFPGNVEKPCKQFTAELKQIRKTMTEASKNTCKVILFYIPIVSRAGTDIEAALQKLNSDEEKYVALVVLHHTFDKESVVPDSSRAVNREKTITVDCLFHEDEGLLKCQKNEDAIKKVADWLWHVKHQGDQAKENKDRSNGKT
ncbi:myosin heavy chain, non-muscle-like isoform X2, partial [Clarias magur]